MVNESLIAGLERGDLVTGAAIMLILIGSGMVLTQVDSTSLSASITSNLCGVSADKVSISSNDPEIGGKTWVVGAIGADQCDNIIEGGAYIPAEDLESYDSSSGEQAKAETGFRAGLSEFNGWISNDVKTRSTSDIVTAYGVERKAISGSGWYGGVVGDDLEECANWQDSNEASDPDLDVPTIYQPYSFSNNPSAYDYVSDQTLHCYRATPREVEVWEFDTGSDPGWKGTFVMEADGDKITKTVTRDEATGGITLEGGGHQAHIYTSGSLVSDVIDTNIDTGRWRPACTNNCNDANNRISWSITSQEYVKSYTDEKQSFDSTVVEFISSGAPEQPVNKVTAAVVDLEQNRDDSLASDIDGGRGWVQDIYFEGMEVRVTAEDDFALGNPRFEFRIPADWVGFFIPVAEPEIQSASDTSLTASETTGTTDISIRNTADVSGTVHASVSCPSPLTAGYDDVEIGAGETRTASVNIDSGMSPDNTYSCDVLVKDTDANSVQDRTSIDVDVSASCTDSDGDGICNVEDDCDNEKGPGYNDGCPIEGPQDSDNDGIPDSEDQCPQEPETYNGYNDLDGCPDERPNPDEETQCNDDIDNDGDGLVDDADPDCDSSGGGVPLAVIGVLFLSSGVGLLFVRMLKPEWLGVDPSRGGIR